MARRARPANDPTKVAAYIRVSTDEQALGPEAQRAALEKWCVANGCTLLAVQSDLGVSGGAAIDKRPALLAALAAVEFHAAGTLLVSRRDRLARDTMNAAMIERMVERMGATIRTVDGTTDGDGPEAVLMRRIVDALAEYERLLVAARTRAALAVKRARQERVGDVRYGYTLADDGKHLQPNADEQRVIALVIECKAQGLSLRRIADRLARDGFLPRSGGRWHAQTVQNILRAA